MLGRVRAVASRHGSFRRVAFFTATTGAVAYRYSTSDLTESTTMRSKSKDVVIPTLEASVRAFRLFVTAVQMVCDYEISKFGAFSQRVASVEEHGKDEKQHWEEELERCRQELERAQIAYTSDTNETDAVDIKRVKEQQKRAVHDAADKLAEAQDCLAEYGDRKSMVHLKAANRLLSLCRQNAGVYIKVGQHLANLDYLIPREYVEVLSSLFDDAPMTAYSDVREVIKEELGEYPEEIFHSFDPEPIASASLAQVHTAVDKRTGKKLAIKVQHRGLRETSSGDLLALTAAVRTLDAMFKDFTYNWIADEIAPQLPKELDFCNEGRNADMAAEHICELGLNCVVPKVIWDQTTERVLCMEFEEGFKATDVDAMKEAGLQKRDVARLVSSVFSAQAFLKGFVHCDPHPANVLIREKNGKPQMVLVDHGLYKCVDDDFRIRYAHLWRSLMMADLEGIKASCKSLGVDEMYTLLAAMLTTRPFDEIIERSKNGSLEAGAKPESTADRAMIQGYAQQYFQEIVAILNTIPRQMLLLLKMNDCLRHIDYSLKSPTNSLVVSGNYAARAVYNNQLQNGTISDRIKSWLDYMKLVVRIKAYDIGVWWMNRSGKTRLLTS